MFVQGIPFYPTGATALIAAATTAPTGVALVGDPTNETIGSRQYRLYNAGSVVAYWATGANAALAQTAAIVPTNASVGGGCPVAAGVTEVVTMPSGLFWSAITVGSNCSFFITVGQGV